MQNFDLMYPGICRQCLQFWLFERREDYYRFKFVCPMCCPEIHERLKRKRYPRRRWASACRKKARRKMKKRGQFCELCGKPKHSVHHIKPLGNFPVGTKPAIVNTEENLLVVCRDCHDEQHS